MRISGYHDLQNIFIIRNKTGRPLNQSSRSGDEFEVDQQIDRLQAFKLLMKASKMKVDFVKALCLEIRNSVGSIKVTNELDLLEDMIDLDMGPLLCSLAAHLKDLVSFACAIIGANVSESFCEREISIVNQIMTKRRTSITDERLEKLTVLKMNRLFIEDMKKQYPKLFSRLNTLYSSDFGKGADNK